TLDHPVPVCADESCHTSADLRRLTNRYEVLNVKLDKTGGLTEALLLSERARESGFKLLIGCMVCTSLGIAPARLLASAADYVDLDGPLLLAGDRHHRLSYRAGKLVLPLRGEVEAFESRDGTEQILATARERDFIGDVAMLQGTSALATVRVTSPEAEILHVPTAELRRAFAELPGVSEVIVKALIMRRKR